MRKLKSALAWLCLSFLIVMTGQASASSSAAEIIADDYGVDKAAVQELWDASWNEHDINRAAFLALASHSTLADVVKYKDIAGSWEGAEPLLGITDWHVESARHMLIANQLHQILGSDRDEVIKLLQQRYHPKAIAAAAAFSTKSSVKIDTILSMKLNQLTWYQTGEKIGLTPSDVDYSIQTLNNAFHQRAAFGDSFGYFGNAYGYEDTSYYGNGYDIAILNFANQ